MTERNNNLISGECATRKIFHFNSLNTSLDIQWVFAAICFKQNLMKVVYSLKSDDENGNEQLKYKRQ